MNRLLIHCRSLARRAGLTQPLSRLLQAISVNGADYEHQLARAVRASIRPGDVVWDVGANLGLYTALALECVGDQGQVVCFEPAPECFRELCRRFEHDPRVRSVNAAVGKDDGVATLFLQANGNAPTHRIADKRPVEKSHQGTAIEVKLMCGDGFVAAGGPRPSLVKIDVEGHEAQVLLGMRHVLRDSQLRHVFVEVHFGLLEQAGEKMAPLQIEQMLSASGFETDWLGNSHLHASRPVVVP